jgi:hypothetical protein
MADINEEETPGYEYPEALKPILALTEEEKADKKWEDYDYQAQKKERLSHYVPISRESAQKIKQAWEEQGGDSYMLRPENYVSKEISHLFSKFGSEAPPITPKRIDEWMDLDGDGTNALVDYDALRSVGIPQDLKYSAVADAMENTLGIAKKYTLAGNDIKVKPDDSLPLRMGKYGLQALDQVVGALGSSAYDHLSSGGKLRDLDPISTLQDDEKETLLNAIVAGETEAKLRGGIKVTLPKFTPDQQFEAQDFLKKITGRVIQTGEEIPQAYGGLPQSLLPVFNQAGKEKILYAWDTVNDATDLAITQDIALGANLLPVLGMVGKLKAFAGVSKLVPGAVATAAKATSALANPLTAAVEGAVGGSLGLKSIMGLGAIEGAAMQRRHLSETGKEAEPLSRAVGGFLGGALPAVVGGAGLAVDKVLKISTRAARQKMAADAGIHATEIMTSISQEEAAAIARGEMDIPPRSLPPEVKEPRVDIEAPEPRADIEKVPPPPPLTPEYKLEVRKAVATKLADPKGILVANDLTMATVLQRGPQTKEIQDILDQRRFLLFGDTVEDSKNRLAFYDMLDQAKKNKTEARAAIEKLEQLSPEMRAAQVAEWDSEIQQIDLLRNSPANVDAIVRNEVPEFFAAVRQVYPQGEGAVRIARGMISTEELYRKELVQALTHSLPDTLEAVKTSEVKTGNKMLAAVRDWWESAPKTQKAIDTAAKAAEASRNHLKTSRDTILSQIAGVRKLYEIEPRPTSPGMEEGRALHLSAVDYIEQAVHKADLNGTLLDPTHISVLTKDLQTAIDPDLHQKFVSSLAEFNELQLARIEAHENLARTVVSSVYATRVNQGKNQFSLTPSAAELHRIGSATSVEETTTALHESFLRMARDHSVEPEDVRTLTTNFGEFAKSLHEGTPIPNRALLEFSAEADKFVAERLAGGERNAYKGKLQEFEKALRKHDADAYTITSVEKSIQLGWDDPMHFAPRIVRVLGDLAERVHSPNLVRRLEVLQASAHRIYMDALREIDLPEIVKLQMYEAQAGGLAAKLRLADDPNFPFRTETHIQNVFDAVKETDKILLNAIDDMHQELLGVPINREFMYGYFMNPLNNYQKSGYLAKLGMNVGGVEFWAKIWDKQRKRSNNRWFAKIFGNTEYMMSVINKDISMSLLTEERNMAAGVSRALAQISNSFKEERAFIRSQLGRSEGWGGKNFKLGYMKLGGSHGVSAVGDLFFGIKVDGTFVKTPVGQWHEYAFTQNWRQTSKWISEGNQTAFQADAIHFLSKTPEFKENPEGAAAAANGLWHYFNDTRIAKMDDVDWKGVWSYARFMSETNLKTYLAAKEVLAKANYENRRLGYNIPMPEWRPFYVYEPSTKHFDIEDFSDRLFRDTDTTKHFGSSLKGQLAKAEQYVLSDTGFTELASPVKIVSDYIHHTLMSAHTIHSRTHLENFGALIHDQGYTLISEWIQRLAKDNLRSDVMKKFFGGKTVAETIRNAIVERSKQRWLIGVEPIAARLLRVYDIGNSLIKPTSLFRNHIQSAFEAAAQFGPARTLQTAANQLFRTVYHALTLNKPLPTKLAPLESVLKGVNDAKNAGEFIVPRDVSPTLEGISKKVLDGYRDNYSRNAMETLNLLVETADAVPIKRGPVRGKATRGMVWVRAGSDALQDIARTQTKERFEAANMKTFIEMGKRVYEKTLLTIQDEGPQAAYLSLSKDMPTFKKNMTWQFITEMERGIKNNDPYMVAEDFLYQYSSKLSGRFSPTAGSWWSNSLMTLFPRTMMFYNARMFKFFRIADTMGDAFQHSASFLRRTEGLPPHQRKAAYSAMGVSLGAILGLYGAEYAGLNLLVSDKIKEEMRPGSLLRRFAEGLGIEFSSYGPMPLADIISGEVFTSGVTRTRGEIGMGGGAYIGWRTLKRLAGAVETYAEKTWVPFESDWEKIQTEKSEYAFLEDSLKTPERWHAINVKEARLLADFKEEALPRFYDGVLGFFGETAVLPWYHVQNEPFLRAYLAKQANQNPAKVNESVRAIYETGGGYAGPIATILAMAGVREKLEPFGVATPEELADDYHQHLSKIGMPKEGADFLAQLMFGYVNDMNEWDVEQHYIHSTGKLEKDPFQRIRTQLESAGKEYVRLPEFPQEEISETERIMQDLEGTTERVRKLNKPKPKGFGK